MKSARVGARNCLVCMHLLGKIDTQSHLQLFVVCGFNLRTYSGLRTINYTSHRNSHLFFSKYFRQYLCLQKKSRAVAINKQRNFRRPSLVNFVFFRTPILSSRTNSYSVSIIYPKSVLCIRVVSFQFLVSTYISNLDNPNYEHT